MISESIKKGNAVNGLGRREKSEKCDEINSSSVEMSHRDADRNPRRSRTFFNVTASAFSDKTDAQSSEFQRVAQIDPHVGRFTESTVMRPPLAASSTVANNSPQSSTSSVISSIVGSLQ
jgi:hypothetical protein